MSKEYLVFEVMSGKDLAGRLEDAAANDWEIASIVAAEGFVLLTLSRDDVAARLNKHALEGLVERLDRYAVHKSECARTGSPVAVCTCGLQEIRRDVDLVVTPF